MLTEVYDEWKVAGWAPRAQAERAGNTTQQGQYVFIVLKIYIRVIR